MKKAHFAFLKTNRACESGLKWAETQSDLYELWNNCHRGDWMLWLADRLKVDKKKQMLCAALCAHTVVHLMTDRRSREAVRIAFLYARGKATDEQLREAREAAWAAGAIADAAAAWATADSWAIAATVAAARAAARAAATKDAHTARQANLQRTAEIARKILTQEVFEKIATMKTFSTILWAVPLVALLSLLFYLAGEALIELAEWFIWRLKLQIKRLKEARRRAHTDKRRRFCAKENY